MTTDSLSTVAASDGPTVYQPKKGGRAPSGGSQAYSRTFMREISEYPHGIHPALVPGVSIEDQKVRYGLDKGIIAVVGVFVVGFIVWGVAAPHQVYDVTTAALNWVMTNLGWVFSVVAIGMVLFLLFLAFTKYGKIPLGLDGDAPEFSTGSWAAMLFGAGIGIGIIFFGPLEPLTHYVSPLPGMYEPASVAAVKGAMVQSALHWGINAWAIYAIVGLAVAYVSYRRGRVPLMSSILTSLWGGDSNSLGARIIDGLAIVATLFGTAASLGIGALQIGRGFQLVTGWSTEANTIALITIIVLTIGTIISAVSGVSKGIRLLSNINMALAICLAAFIFLVGPTVFLANIIPGVITEYFAELPRMLSATTADSPEIREFLSSWTIFYWAWWVSWAPFVGVFVAKISKGRTIRQFVFGVLLIPSTIIILAFTILGGTAIWLQREYGELIPGNDPLQIPPAQDVFFLVLDYLPGHQFVAPVVMVMLAVFFITSADSASLVNSQLSQKGNPNPNRLITAFWAIAMAGIAVVMLLMGGQDALQGLQNLITITALPFSVVIIFMAIALYRELHTDPMVIRYSFAKAAVSNAIVHGIEEHGDNFEIAVAPVEPDSDRAAGADFDSTAEEVTEWYTRTDEDGNVVEYDYEAGEYVEDEDQVDGRAQTESDERGGSL
ncbi:BCCT family transporter [Schaalia sp. ZJ405]|nr:BCCT family transporter [Schaalia sp. ZJ405]